MLWDREAYNPWNRLQLQRDAYTCDPSATYYTRPFAEAWPSLFERERLLPFVAVVVVILPYLPASVRLAVHWELNSKSCTQALRSKRQPKIMLNEKHPQRHKNKCRFESVAGLTESKRARHPSTWAPRRHARLKIRMPCQPMAGENQSLLIIIAPLPLEYNVCYTEYKPCHAEYYACCTRWQPKSLNSPVVSRYQGGTG